MVKIGLGILLVRWTYTYNLGDFMKKIIFALLTLIFALPSYSEPAQDKLDQCLADSTTGKDRKDLVRWVVSSMAQHPAMEDLVSVPPEKVDALNKVTAALYTRLVFVDCLADVKAAVKIGGQKSIGKSFESLGRLAMQELMTNPKVAEAMGGIGKYADTKKFQELLSAP
jgi:hypothetical protein